MKVRNLLRKINEIYKDPEKYFQKLKFLKTKSEFIHKIAPYSWVDDKYWIDFFFYRQFGYRPNFSHPKTFNEKIQWVKLNYRKKLYGQLADKFLARDYVEKKIGSQYLVPLVGVYDKFEQIPWEKLPNKFVLKMNHGCGWNIICEDKHALEAKDVFAKIESWSKLNYYEYFREWQYKNISPKIIIEKYLQDGSSRTPKDYKVFCFNGKAEFIMVCDGRQEGNLKFYYYDRNWNLCPLSKDSKEAPPGFSIPKPKGFEELLECAENLSEPFPFVRVDFYIIAGKPVFGEFTFTPSAGFFVKARLYETDVLFGELFPITGEKLAKDL